VLFFVGSSIKAARSSNRYILELEADSKLFEEVLEPLKKATPVPTLVILTCMEIVLRMMKILQ
jgi:hypothetical protein